MYMCACYLFQRSSFSRWGTFWDEKKKVGKIISYDVWRVGEKGKGIEGKEKKI